MTKEYIKEAYDRLRKRLKHQPSKKEFHEQTTVKHHHILQTFRTFSKLVEEMGDAPKTFLIERKGDDEFMLAYGNIVKQLGRIPTVSDWIANKYKPSDRTYTKRFNLDKFTSMAYKFKEFAEGKEEWMDVLQIIPELSKKPKLIFKNQSEECYVYLMLDSKNGYYKIGISNVPEWREKTLQSEKPSILLIAFKKYINRRIAANIEKALHESYSHRKKRGEWFMLDDEDVEEIKATLSN